MNQKEFDVVAQELLDLAEKIRSSKGKDYSEDNDRLSNFKTIAKEIGVKPSLVWAVYFRKHIDAIMKHTREGQTESEPIEGRLADVLNYILLYYGLIRESAQVQTGPEAQYKYTGVNNSLPLCKGSRLNAAPISVTPSGGLEVDGKKLFKSEKVRNEVENLRRYELRGGPGVD